MKQKLVYRGRSIAVYQEKLRLENGHEIVLDIIRHPGASAVVPFLSENEVLLIRQFRHAAGGVIYEVPAGKLDGDTPEVCAVRELEEEAGQHTDRLVKVGEILTSPGFTDERIHLFAAFELSPVPQRLETDELIELVPIPFSRALELVWRGEIPDAKSALALLHAARHLGRI